MTLRELGEVIGVWVGAVMAAGLLGVIIRVLGGGL
jgi:hypothetical protein